MVNGGRVTVNADALPPEKKVYFLRNPPNINYNDEISNQRSMGWINLVVGARDLHNATMAYVNIVNAIATFLNLPHQTTS